MRFFRSGRIQVCSSHTPTIAMRIGMAMELRSMWDRSKTMRGGVQVDADRRGPVEHAAQVAVDQAVEDEGDVEAPGPYIVYVDVHRLGGFRLGVAQLLDDVREDRLAVGDVLVDVGVGHLEREAGALVQAVAHRHLDDGAQEGELAGGGDGGVEGVEADAVVVGDHRVQADGGYPQLLGDEVPFADAVLALGVQHHDLAVAEAELAQDVGLLQGGLAVAGFAQDQPVGGRQLLAVQLEGVVDVPLAAVDLAADDHAGVAEAGGRGRQVDGLGLARGGADGQAGRLDLAEEEGGEGFGEDGQRISHRSVPLRP
ncbi:hypothetical protein GCM10019017_38730 [Streptomyces showdoensis]